jgi:hypothetical protein
VGSGSNYRIGVLERTNLLRIKGSGRPVSRILLYPAIHLRENLPGSSLRSCAYQPERLAAPGQFGLLAPVVYLAGPSRDTAGGLLPHPFTHHLCSKVTPHGRSLEPSAGLLSVALDVTGGLGYPVPRVVSPSGRYGSELKHWSSRVRTFLYAAASARHSDGSDGRTLNHIIPQVVRCPVNLSGRAVHDRR